MPALVERATWERAGAQLLRNRALSTRSAKRTYLPRGLVRCAACGSRFVGTPTSGRSGWRSHYYRCGSQLAAKEAERERVMTLYRGGRATLADAEAQLDAIQAEAGELRAALDAMRTQEELAQAFEAHYADAAALLARLGDRLAEIEATDDRDTKRQVVELLVSDVAVTTHGGGRNKEAEIAVTYAFSSRQVVDATTSRRGCGRGRG